MIETRRAKGWGVSLLLVGMLVGLALAQGAVEQSIDWDKARQLRTKQKQGQTLTQEETKYLQRAMEARRKMPRGGPKDRAGRQRPPQAEGKSSMDLVPLTDMTGKDKYKGEEGGLYGAGKNRPPKAHQEAAERELARIRPLDAKGAPAKDGKIVLISVGMSNTTQEFSMFKKIADSDKDKSPDVVVVDCAQGGRDIADWVDKDSKRYPTVWPTVKKRLDEAGVTGEQVQVVWIKQARRVPSQYGEFPKHVEEFQSHLVRLLGVLKQQFPNLRIAYLSSRIYAGYAVTALNPEPYAYENAFTIRGVIRRQMKGDEKLNCDPARGQVHSPLLLWGPYLWANGIKGRKTDGLIYKREDFRADGTHPSDDSGRKKVAQQLLTFFKTDPNARTWFAATP